MASLDAASRSGSIVEQAGHSIRLLTMTEVAEDPLCAPQRWYARNSGWNVCGS